MKLIKSELNALYRYALALAQEEAKAYDLVHSALIKVLAKNPKNLLSYARVSIRNLYFDEYRKNKKFEHEELSESTQNLVQIAGRSLEDIYIEVDTVEKILNQLQPQERELLFLYAVEEMTFAEIAEETGEKKGTLLSRMHRLREKFNKKEEVKNVIIP